MTTAISAAIFWFAFWLGCYLLGRDARSAVLRLAGLGLIAYAGVLALDAINVTAASPPLLLARARWSLPFLPAVCWSGALIALVPEAASQRRWLQLTWRFVVVPVTAAGVLLGLTTNLLTAPSGHAPRYGFAYSLLSALAIGALLGATALIWYAARASRSRSTGGLLVMTLIFFGLSTALLLFPPGWLPRIWTLLLVEMDIIILGVIIAVRDAFDQGETLVPDMVRSLVLAAVAAILFGGLVGATIALTGASTALVGLLFAVVAVATGFVVFIDQVNLFVDRVALRRLPRVRQTRAELRAAASALPRVNPALDVEAMEPAEFQRLTRRAISAFGDLPRLAASPLTHLALIDARLTARNAPDDPLERAAELKAALAESIARLKPRSGGDFGTSDEWRYYNALYFPYLVGLKPYSRRLENGHGDPASRAALDWFRTSVPERTLYNWQTAATRLVAQDLRGRTKGKEQ
jgi:hypothetical protein